MLAILSPAKTLDFESPDRLGSNQQPEFLRESTLLAEVLRGYTAEHLAKLMKLSPSLAETNRRRYQTWRPEHAQHNARPAILAFRGDVYRGLDTETLSDDDLRFAEKHVRILSGLYGVLKPFDLIQPYRLEMGTALTTVRGKNLYEFWGNRITDALDRAVADQGDNVLIHLASDEYFRAVNTERLGATVIRPVFKERRNGTYRVIALRAKRARGLFCGFLLRNRGSTLDSLSSFDAGGYAFNAGLSTPSELVFTRG